MSNVSGTFSKLFAAINKTLRRSGFEIKKTSNLPRFNWLGLRNIDFSTILDVGANEGQFAEEIRCVFPAAHIYSFEPIPQCFKSLQKKCAQSELWSCYNVALAESEKTAVFNLHEDNMPSSSLLEATDQELNLYPKSRRQRQVEVNCITLDKWILSNADALKQPSLLKLDVQGYELNVLRGAFATLDHINAVICEINIQNFYEQQSSFPDIVNLFYSRGIHFHGVLEHTYDDANNVIAFDAIFRRHAIP
jgi:FkbM family methyltransferase